MSPFDKCVCWSYFYGTSSGGGGTPTEGRGGCDLSGRSGKGVAVPWHQRWDFPVATVSLLFGGWKGVLAGLMKEFKGLEHRKADHDQDMGTGYLFLRPPPGYSTSQAGGS